MNKNIINNIKYENKKRKFVKYILFSLILFNLIKFLPKIKISSKDNIMISVLSMVVFTIIDNFSPSITIKH